MSGISGEKKRIDRGHYLWSAIEKTCDGKTVPEYWPEFTSSGWICCCGQENPAAASVCSSCGASKEWLKDAFDREKLARIQLTLDNAHSVQRQIDREEKRKARGRKKAVRFSLLLLLILAVAAGVVLLSVTVISPAVARHSADALFSSGDYLEAARRYRDLGDDGKVRLCRQKHADKITGIENAYWSDSSVEKWFLVSEDGKLKIRLDDLEASGVSLDPLILPDVVDDIAVVALDERALMNAESVLSVQLPANLKEIGERAFFKCTALTEIILPEGVDVIGDRAFINCISLTRLVLPEGLKEIGIRLCNNCVSLTEVVFGPNVESVGSYAFAECSSLKTVRLSPALKTVGDSAFVGCDALESVLYPGTPQDFESVHVGETNEPLLDSLVFSQS